MHATHVQIRQEIPGKGSASILKGLMLSTEAYTSGISLASGIDRFSEAVPSLPKFCLHRAPGLLLVRRARRLHAFGRRSWCLCY